MKRVGTGKKTWWDWETETQAETWMDVVTPYKVWGFSVRLHALMQLPREGERSEMPTCSPFIRRPCWLLVLRQCMMIFRAVTAIGEV